MSSDVSVDHGTSDRWSNSPILASWISRVLATILDGLILLLLAIPCGALVVPFAVMDSEVLTIVTGVIAALVYCVVVLAYAPILMGRSGELNGQTWGKQAAKIRVVLDSGEQVSRKSGAIREIVVKTFVFGFLGGWVAGAPTLLDLLWPIWDDENRALHDMLAQSHVVVCTAPQPSTDAGAGLSE